MHGASSRKDMAGKDMVKIWREKISGKDMAGIEKEKIWRETERYSY